MNQKLSLTLALAAIGLSGCADNPSKAHDYCNNDKPIKFHTAADVAALPDYLAKEIDAHNAAYRKACN